MNKERICLVYNTGRYLYRFRRELIEKLIKEGATVSAIFPFDDYLDPIQSLGVECFDLDIDAHDTGLLKQFKLYKNLKTVIKKINPDKVLSFTIKPVILTSIMAKEGKYKFFPMITGIGKLYIGNDLKTRLIRGLVNAVYKRYFNYNKIAFFQNTDDRDLFINAGFIDPDKVVMINGSGVNLDTFPVKDCGYKPKKIVFLMAGRLDDTKGLFEYLNAANLVRENYSSDQCEFLLAGEVHESAKEDSILSAIRSCENVNYLGLQENMQDIYAGASVFVLPSYREGTSRAILEAMSTGLPIITTDVPGCREPVSHNHNGIIVPMKNVTELARAMEKFIGKPDLLLSMGINSRNIVEQYYDVNNIVSLMYGSISE